MADLESTIIALGPQWYYPGRIQSAQLIDRSANIRQGTVVGDGAASGPALFAGSTSPSDNMGSTGEFRLLVATSGVPMLANQSSSIGLVFMCVNTGIACLLSDQTCTSPSYAVYLNNGQYHVGLGTAAGIVYAEDRAGPVGLHLNDGVPHLLVWTINGTTHAHTVYVDGVQQSAFSATTTGALWQAGANHYMGEFANCARNNVLSQGYLQHWFAFNSELTLAQVQSIQAAAGAAASGTALNPPTLGDTQAITTANNALLTAQAAELAAILAAVRKTY